MLYGSAQLENILVVFQVEKARFFAFAKLRCWKSIKKGFLQQTEHWELNSFTNIVAKIGVDALKIYEQVRLKIGKKLSTVSLNSKFTYKKS